MRSTVPIRLSEVPSAFLPDEWSRYRAAFASDGRALQDLDSLPAAQIAQMARRNVEYRNDFDGSNAETVATHDRGMAIVERLRTMLCEGNLLATGISPPNVERVKIPSEMWRTLKLDFPSDAASDRDFRFAHIRVAPSAKSDVVLMQCVAWFLERGDRVKKELMPLAFAQFPELTQKKVSEAYRIAFDRRPGRPPKARPEI